MVTVAVVGATGAVGTEMLKVLEQRNFPLDNLVPLASKRSAGRELEFKNKKIKVAELTENSFNNIDIALFSAGGDVSKQFVPIAVKNNCVVVDNTSAFRMDPDVPLVIPEVNPEDIKKHKGIISNPNCSTIQMVVALSPIHKKYKIQRVVVTTFQSVSGAGYKAIEELKQQSLQFLNGEDVIANIFPRQIAFNPIPQIPQKDAFEQNNYTTEEMKMINETKKILHDDSIKVTATCVRIPAFRAHCEAVNVQMHNSFELDEVISLLQNSPGLFVNDNGKQESFPDTISASYKDEVFVGRIRKDLSIENCLDMWIASDNLRKGAALNAVQIAEILAI